MTDRPTLIRQWRLLRILSSSKNGWLVRDLARELSVSEKSVRRDLDSLTLAGFHLSETVEDHGRKRWRLVVDPSIPPLELTLAEAAALHLSRRLMEPLAGTTIWDSTQSVFAKLQGQFAPETLAYLQSLATTLHETAFGQSDYSDRAEVIDGLMLGINEQRVTRLLYHPLRSELPEEYELYPLGLIWHRHSLYLVANSQQDSDPRHFKLDRLREVQVLDETFIRPADFDLQVHLKDAFAVYRGRGPLRKVRVCFAEPVARYVSEHRWHGSQIVTEQPDGGLIVELELNDLKEVKSWVLGFGSHATVLEPAELRDSVISELTEALAGYERTQVKPNRSQKPEVAG